MNRRHFFRLAGGGAASAVAVPFIPWAKLFTFPAPELDFGNRFIQAGMFIQARDREITRLMADMIRREEVALIADGRQWA